MNIANWMAIGEVVKTEVTVKYAFDMYGLNCRCQNISKVMKYKGK